MRFLHLLLIPLFLLGMAGCQKEEDDLNPDIENTPSALAEYNSSSAGVYKGVLVGSSGNFKLSINNGDEDISCEFIFDGKKATLTTTSLNDWTPGEPITNALFTGTWDGKSVSLTFSCQANGSSPIISVNVPDHTVYATIYKETSNLLVKCYEGTYTISLQDGPIQGTWNFIIVGNLMVGYHADSESKGVISGTLQGTTLTMENETLTVTETSVSGSFQDGDGDTITVTGKRTL